MESIIDNHGRTVNYLRLAVTDRCNLRCFYCMPNEGIEFVDRKELLSFEEMLRICQILGSKGIHKIRLTGGEPFVRKGIMEFIRALSKIEEIKNIHITTNGTLTRKYLDELIKLGITSYNLSIDSLDKDRFKQITRRDYFPEVMSCLEEMMAKNLDVKLNCVVMENQNTEDIIPMVALAKNHDIAVRFIEEMPFNGNGKDDESLTWNYKKILAHIQTHFGLITKLEDPAYSTSLNYKVEGFKGSFGIIPAFSRTFCGTCNRIRLTPKGMIKTCLYDDGIFNLKNLIRSGASDEAIAMAIQEATSNRAKDGFEAQQNRLNTKVSESMASIGG